MLESQQSKQLQEQLTVRNLKLCYGQRDNREIVIEVPTNTNPYTFHFPIVKAIGKTRKETRDQKMHVTWGIYPRTLKQRERG